MPPDMLRDRYVAQRVRMFVIAHLFGPTLAQPIFFALLVLDDSRGWHLWIVEGMILLFWVFPGVLRLLGGRFEPLVLVSTLHLIATILFAAYHYGGVLPSRRRN